MTYQATSVEVAWYVMSDVYNGSSMVSAMKWRTKFRDGGAWVIVECIMLNGGFIDNVFLPLEEYLYTGGSYCSL
jgi:hypothetical protein